MGHDLGKNFTGRPLAADEFANQDPRIDNGSHRLSPRRFDICIQFFITGAGVHLCQPVPDFVEAHQ